MYMCEHQSVNCKYNGSFIIVIVVAKERHAELMDEVKQLSQTVHRGLKSKNIIKSLYINLYMYSMY